MSFKPSERERLELAGFTVLDDVAHADGATVTITPMGDDGRSTTTIALPSGAYLRLEMQQKAN
jgi:hypothetical protein